MASCGSPLLDHEVKQYPVLGPSISTSTAASSTTTTINLDTVPSDCESRFESSNLCFKIDFTESPSFQASLKSFSAILRVWNSDAQQWASLNSDPIVFHQHPEQCCLPPPIVVNQKAEGRFELTNIEFHAEGVFDFFIEIEPKDKIKDRIMVNINVASR